MQEILHLHAPWQVPTYYHLLLVEQHQHFKFSQEKKNHLTGSKMTATHTDAKPPPTIEEWAAQRPEIERLYRTTKLADLMESMEKIGFYAA
jgi:hypothetical protein